MIRLRGAQRSGNRMHTGGNDASKGADAAKGSAAPAATPSSPPNQTNYTISSKTKDLPLSCWNFTWVDITALEG